MQLGIKHVRWIALLSCIFLLASVLDNIPDCPELLSLNGGTPTCTKSGATHNPVVLPDILVEPNSSLSAATSYSENARDLVALVPTSSFVRAIFQAANTSPPSV